MKITRLSLAKHLALPAGVKAILTHSPEVQPFIRDFANEASFKAYANERAHPAGRRKLLADVAIDQNARSTHKPVIANAAALADHDTLTVTTGHQLNVFGGPAYFVWKITHTIALANYLKRILGGRKVVPVFWLASEDHDIAEIDHVYGHAERHEWVASGRGPAGRLTTQGLSEMLEAFIADLPGLDKETSAMLREVADAADLSDATRRLVDYLFGCYGVVCIDADQPELKRAFVPVMLAELSESRSFTAVNECNDALGKANFRLQLTPREINLFYIGVRDRSGIIKDGNRYRAGDDLNASFDEITDLANHYPERFSPNVVLRPVYQEFLLPNLAYVGGPGEISYWLQLSKVFERYEVPFPLLVPRLSAVVLDARTSGLMHEMNLNPEDLFTEEHALIKRLLEHHEDTEKFAEFASRMTAVYNDITAHLTDIDSSLKGRVQAALARQNKELSGLEASALRARKLRDEVTVNRVRKIKSIAFPEGVFQERRKSYFALTAMCDGVLLEELVHAIAPLHPELLVVQNSHR